MLIWFLFKLILPIKYFDSTFVFWNWKLMFIIKRYVILTEESSECIKYTYKYVLTSTINESGYAFYIF